MIVKHVQEEWNIQHTQNKEIVGLLQFFIPRLAYSCSLIQGWPTPVLQSKVVLLIQSKVGLLVLQSKVAYSCSSICGQAGLKHRLSSVNPYKSMPAVDPFRKHRQPIECINYREQHRQQKSFFQSYILKGICN